AYRLALKARARAAKRKTHEKEAPVMERTEEADAGGSDLHSVLDEELSRLAAKHREPLVLCYLQGKTNEEAAKELGLPAGSMSRHLTRGRELLRERLSQRGVALSAGVFIPALAECASAAPVPAHVIENALRAGLSLASGQAAAGSVSAEALALADSFL